MMKGHRSMRPFTFRVSALAFAAAGLALGGTIVPHVTHAATSRGLASNASRDALPHRTGLRTAGTLTFGTNFPYAPMEYYTGANTDIPTGADVDLGRAIAARLHLKAAFVPVNDFGAIILGLNAHHYDVIISSMNETPDRARVVSFVPYATVGQSILVRRGNPRHISSVADLAGQTVGVQSGTTELDTLTAENKVLARHGKAAIRILSFPQDATAILGLRSGRFGAIMEDYPVAAYNATLNPTVFQVAGQQISPAPYAMAFRKDEGGLRVSVSSALATMRANGAYIRILTHYNLRQAALK